VDGVCGVVELEAGDGVEDEDGTVVGVLISVGVGIEDEGEELGGGDEEELLFCELIPWLVDVDVEELGEELCELDDGVELELLLCELVDEEELLPCEPVLWLVCDEEELDD